MQQPVVSDLVLGKTNNHTVRHIELDLRSSKWSQILYWKTNNHTVRHTELDLCSSQWSRILYWKTNNHTVRHTENNFSSSQWSRVLYWKTNNHTVRHTELDLRSSQWSQVLYWKTNNHTLSSCAWRLSIGNSIKCLCQSQTDSFDRHLTKLIMLTCSKHSCLCGKQCAQYTKMAFVCFCSQRCINVARKSTRTD